MSVPIAILRVSPSGPEFILPAPSGSGLPFALVGGAPGLYPNPTDITLPGPNFLPAILSVPMADGESLNLQFCAPWIAETGSAFILDWQSSPDGLAWSALNTLAGSYDSPLGFSGFVNLEGIYTHAGAAATVQFRIRLQVLDGTFSTLVDSHTMLATKIALQV